ncbi:hypothetical protein M9Y10_021741 [Tritrichomonas musculus]|uniref:Uncharacterized protein n=1 Tax=Tritrichomonas musculus TaxID=1915356 RepID=A0ABR2KQD9_9EUKA
MIKTRRESKIPRKSISHNETDKDIKSKFNPRSSTASTKSTKLKERPPINSIEPNSFSKRSFFKVSPTEKSLTERKLPNELLGKPRIIGNEAQIESLFYYTKEIAHNFFAKSQYSVLFPSFFNVSSISRLSFISNSSRSSSISASSKIPVLRKSSIAPDIDLTSKEPSEKELSMDDAFELLNSILNKQKSSVTYLSDFYLLYVSLVLSICNQKAATNALQFLSSFLEFKSTRTQEVNILFAVLIRVCDGAPELRETVVDCLAKLAQLEPTLAKRLENGSTHRDPSLSSLCKDVIIKLGRDTTESKEIFTSISDTDDIEKAKDQLAIYVDTLEDNGQPSDIVDFVRNITSVMNRFHESAVVLERAASCVESVIPFCEDLPIELIYNCLSLCFSIMSGEMFLSGDRAFYASEAIQSLQQSIFDSIPPQNLIPALASILSQPNVSDDNSKIKMVIDNIDSYIKSLPDDFDKSLVDQIYEAIDIFHPEIRKPLFSEQKECDSLETIDLYENSLRKLNSQDTILEEIDSLVNSSKDCNFNAYPIYLQPILQMAWIIQNEDAPLNEENIDPAIYNDVHAIIEKINNLDDDQIDDSEFGLDYLQKELDDIIKSDSKYDDDQSNDQIEIEDDI